MAGGAMNTPLTDWYLRCPVCGGVAYWLRRPVRELELLMAADCVHIDGSPATWGEVLTCGSCNARPFLEELSRATLDDLVRPASDLGSIQ